MKSRAAVAFAPEARRLLKLMLLRLKGEVLIKTPTQVSAIPMPLPSQGMTLRAFSRWFSATREPVSSLKLVKASPV